ncbi:MAG TPA: ATP-binding cassette domain-containing protein [Pararhizobium sp.]|uniref:ATP-binding cassette domain-containing protein n=1 Tax=Pararhizobium sp. TaxID=1977563 RepID=UPI002B66A968|nr:ATP-binding cassette domain-containing protein [Pararhizobium sp.]HTO30691.1 ATP-binding cassette domain-containing protein [Pararhizobium sp.]
MTPDGKTDGLQIRRMTIGLAGRTLLSMSATIRPGEILTVMGPSGSGKSALLATLGGFLDPAFTATGDILIDGSDLTDIPAEKRGAGMLFQDALLFPHLSVGDNLLFGLSSTVRSARERRQLVEQALVEIELTGFFDRDPATLSGGQKARVALQRTLLSAPRFLLLDEPFSKLDTDLRHQVRDLVFTRAKALKLPVVLVTHDRSDALAAGGETMTIGAEP